MVIEFRILDFLQGIRTPAGDAVICFATKLGDTGMIGRLLIIPKTRKTGIVMLAALCIDLIVCSGILKNLFVRIPPCEVNTQVPLLIARPDDFSYIGRLFYRTCGGIYGLAAIRKRLKRDRPQIDKNFTERRWHMPVVIIPTYKSSYEKIIHKPSPSKMPSP